MSTPEKFRNAPISHNLHPHIYGLLVGSVIWITLVVWAFFGSGAYTALQLAVVAAFALAFVATPLVLWRISAAKQEEAGSLQSWLETELETHTGVVHGAHAAVMVLLAPAACAFGLTGVSLVAWLAAA